MDGGIELFKRTFGLREYHFVADRNLTGTEIDHRTATVRLGAFITTGRMLEVFESIEDHELPKAKDIPVLAATIP